MAGKKKSGKSTENVTSDAAASATGTGRKPEREGPHGERLSEQEIDAEVSSKTMEGGHSVPEDDVEDAFKQDSSNRGGSDRSQ